MTVFFFITSIMKSNLDVEPMTFMFHDNWSITNPLHLLPYHRLGLSVSYSQHFSSQYPLSLIFPKIFSSNFEKVLARLMNQSTFHIYFWGVNRKKEAVVFFLFTSLNTSNDVTNSCCVWQGHKLRSKTKRWEIHVEGGNYTGRFEFKT